MTRIWTFETCVNYFVLSPLCLKAFACEVLSWDDRRQWKRSWQITLRKQLSCSLCRSWRLCLQTCWTCLNWNMLCSCYGSQKEIIRQTLVSEDYLGWRLLLIDLHEDIKVNNSCLEKPSRTSCERRIRCLSVTQWMYWNILPECAECCRTEVWWNGLYAAVITSTLSEHSGDDTWTLTCPDWIFQFLKSVWSS